MDNQIGNSRVSTIILRLDNSFDSYSEIYFPHLMNQEYTLFHLFVHPPTQEIAALAVEEYVTADANSVSDGSTKLRRISLTGG